MSPDSSWHAPPAAPVLKDNEIHVWRAVLDLPAAQVQALAQTLSVDEIARAKRFYFERDRAHFTVARAALRSILGHYVEIAPRALRFRYGARGKPALVPECGGDALCFNLSHSHGLALYAVTRRRAVGIDVEQVSAGRDDEGIAARFFSPREVGMLRALPAQMHRDAFFACWTRKEAFIKATGDGFSLALDQFDVSVAPTEPAQLLAVRDPARDARRWWLCDLPADRGFAAALAVEGPPHDLAFWQWIPPASSPRS